MNRYGQLITCPFCGEYDKRKAIDHAYPDFRMSRCEACFRTIIKYKGDVNRLQLDRFRDSWLRMTEVQLEFNKVVGVN